MLDDQLLTLGISLLIQAVFFAFAVTLKTDKVTDLSYGLTFALLTVVLYSQSGHRRLPPLVLAGMVIGWFLLDHDLAALQPAEGQPLTDEAKAAIRFIGGMMASICEGSAAIRRWVIADFVSPGQIALTVMLSPTNSAASARVRPSTPCLDAA